MHQKEGENSQSTEIIEVIAKGSAQGCPRVKEDEPFLQIFSESFWKLDVILYLKARVTS